MDTIACLYPLPGRNLDLSQENVEKILCLVENVRPEEVTRSEQWEHIGPHSFAEVRLALAQKAIECTGRKATRDALGLTYEAEKQLAADSVAYLYVQYPLGVMNEEESLPELI